MLNFLFATFTTGEGKPEGGHWGVSIDFVIDYDEYVFVGQYKSTREGHALHVI